MLQQTQVKTVIPYYRRFLKHFPELTKLATASLDEVLAQWSGLGYYARARNLHKAAQLVVLTSEIFPHTAAELLELPGIGLSTANAIASQATNIPLPILDGNAKRIFARHAGISGWPGHAVVQKKLWQAAADRLTTENGAAYTQAVMDLGAGICSRTKPDCSNCPVQADCFALHADCIADFPGRKATKKNPEQYKQVLINRDPQGRVYLQKRPPTGIWGGLWSLPEISRDKRYANSHKLPVLVHDFSHFRLHITPLLTNSLEAKIKDTGSKWFSTEEWRLLGLPAPIRQILEQTVKIPIHKNQETGQ